MASGQRTKEQILGELAGAQKRIKELETGLRDLKAASERFRQIVQNANSIILVMDTDGKINFINQFGQRFFGFYEKDILGKSVVGTIVSDTDISGQDLVRIIDDIVKNPERHSTNENENIRSSGERVRVFWKNKALIGDDGSIKEILCIGNAISP